MYCFSSSDVSLSLGLPRGDLRGGGISDDVPGLMTGEARSSVNFLLGVGMIYIVIVFSENIIINDV